MKDIGVAFKEARESIGIAKSEVLKDLNITEKEFERRRQKYLQMQQANKSKKNELCICFFI